MGNRITIEFQSIDPCGVPLRRRASCSYWRRRQSESIFKSSQHKHIYSWSIALSGNIIIVGFVSMIVRVKRHELSRRVVENHINMRSEARPRSQITVSLIATKMNCFVFHQLILLLMVSSWLSQLDFVSWDFNILFSRSFFMGSWKQRLKEHRLQMQGLREQGLQMTSGAEPEPEAAVSYLRHVDDVGQISIISYRAGPNFTGKSPRSRTTSHRLEPCNVRNVN